MKFTKQIKEDWLKALKSGKYVQTECTLIEEMPDSTLRHCCIGVLGEILPFLNNNYKGNDSDPESPYKYLTDNLNMKITMDIYSSNDCTFNPNKPDYSNVIPLIEQLETND